MDFTEHYIPIVLLACLIVGYILKKWVKDLEDKYIPTILAVMGAILGCVANGALTLENVVYGAITGLASTGVHQAFKQMVEKNKK